jgi:diguanylate cyclase (GGDEF)-like protein
MTLVVILQAGALIALALARSGGMPLALRLVLALMAAEALGASIVALAHRGATRRARKQRLLGELAAEVNRAILLNEDEGRIFSTILNYAFRILENVNLGSVLALDESGELVIAASQGFSQDFVKGFRLRLEDSFQYRQSGGNICEAMIIKPEIIKGFADRLDSSDREYRSIISAPLFVDGRLYGFLNVDSLRAGCFGADDLALLKKFASQIEVCLLARERYRASLAESRVDGLTGFLTRSRFDEILDHAIKHAERYGGTFTIGMFDVDGLKAVNDGLGHPAGDLVLAAVADSIRRMARKSDILGRYGGDEFVAVYFASDAAAMGERTRRNLADLASGTVSFAGRALPASYCFGFADFPADSRDRAGLVAVADARLYAMKASRRA